MEPWQVNEIHAGVQGEGRQAVDRVARLVSVGDQGDRTGRQGSGGRAGDAAPLAQQDGRHGRGGDQAAGRGRDGGVEGSAGRGRAIEARERDIDDGIGFFRGQARPDTALMVAYIDEFKDRSRVGPIPAGCRPNLWTAGSSRRAATACSNPGPSAA